MLRLKAFMKCKSPNLSAAVLLSRHYGFAAMVPDLLSRIAAKITTFLATGLLWLRPVCCLRRLRARCLTGQSVVEASIGTGATIRVP